MPANLYQSQWTWSGWSGAPGYTSFYYSTIDEATMNTNLDAERTFFDTVASLLAASVSINPPGNFRVVDAATGNLEDVIAPTTPPTGVTGGGGTTFAAPAGCSVNWLTTTPATSRLVVGRTYLVPLGEQAYQSDGTLVDSSKNGLQTAANVFVAAVDPIFVVWRRPVSGAGGSVAPVVGARVNDRVSILKSRRS